MKNLIQEACMRLRQRESIGLKGMGVENVSYLASASSSIVWFAINVCFGAFARTVLYTEVDYVYH